MNRRELLREMSRVQATWVNRNAPGTGDVDIAVEDEQDYLTRIAAVFERAREDVRRKRGRSVTAAAPAVAAQAAIGALLLAYDPNQKRGPGGRWAKVGDGVPSTGRAFDGVARPGSPQRLSPREFGEKVPQGSRFYRGVTSTEAASHTRGGGIGGGDYGPGIYMDPRIAVAQSYSGRSGGTVMRLGLKPGTKVKAIPQRVQLRGSAAVDEWAREGGHDVISTGDGTYTIVRNPDVLIVDERDYTPRESTILEYLDKGYDMPEGYEAEVEALRRDGVFSALDAFRYDPGQPRDRRGRWSDREGAVPSTPSAVPVAKSRPKPEPAKAMTPEATLAAAPKALDAERGRGLSKPQVAALERYRGSDFAEINAALRGSGKKTASIDRTVAEMDQAHADSKLTEDVVVHRGIGNVDKVFGAASKKNLTGAEWVDEAPQSTTADPDIADRFQRSEGAGRRTDARLIVRVPAGIGAIQLSDERYEAEMLLERGLRMRVISDTGPWRRGQKKPRTIEVEVVPA